MLATLQSTKLSVCFLPHQWNRLSMRFNRILALILVALFLVGCKTTPPFQAYQGLSDKQILERGEYNMSKRHYDQAVKDFEALDTLYPFGQYSQQGQLDIIYAYYKSDDNESALAAADRYIRLYPRSSNVDYAYYLKGLINSGDNKNWFHQWIEAPPEKLDLTDQKQAFQDFNTLIEQFPNSKYAPDARARMIYIRNLLAQHQLEIAQYYMRRKAYVAAANRAGDVVRSYPGAPQVIPALHVMVEAYTKLNEPDMANDALRVLNTNYPNAQVQKTR